MADDFMERDLTKGSIGKSTLLFSIPMILGNLLLCGYYRGVGKMKMSLILTIVSLETRVLLSYLLARLFGVEMIWWSIVIGWILPYVIGIIYGIKIEKWR